ncbi:unnamed protein product [Clonostachys rhizophaga]|uniref:Beta-glucuronidase C-terminal domain-containing protein n=1 Tax=Clonostachys rhizophaga TaxID=160324 RepID=A0A9N9VF25_9HYPO|nr:unnamed protein product [Clonostachys rhizophaga]
MWKLLSFLAHAGSAWCYTVGVHLATPTDIRGPIGVSFVSFSIEFSWFPEFAGNLSTPNTFTNQLLSNLGRVSGKPPYIRVGGNSQDNALYDPELEAAYKHVFNNPDIPYPTSMTYGKAYFEGYQTLSGVKFSHGFNLGANETNGGIENLRATFPLVCEAIGKDNFAFWEIGNEADTKSNRGPIRDHDEWGPAAYTEDWQSRMDLLAAMHEETCGDKPLRMLGPSFAGLRWVEQALDLGLGGQLGAIGTHHYIANSLDPQVTLRGYLLNHTLTREGLASQERIMQAVEDTNLPYIIGEGNSLYNQGRPGASDVFGAALWNIDFSLLAASLGIHRIYFHQGVNYIYAGWQPSHVGTTHPSTKPPYYGHVAAATTLGNSGERDVQVAELPLGSETDSAYAIYEDGKLSRIAVLNMREYNHTSDLERPNQTYTFSLNGRGRKCGHKMAAVQRLLADGADSISGISWNGYSYNHDLDGGKPVLLSNVTAACNETVRLLNGTFSVDLSDSSFALINLQ